MLRKSDRVGRPLEWQEYLTTWSALHSNIDPSSTRVVSTWLRVMFVLSRPLVVRGISPHAVTVAGVGAAAIAVAASAAGSHWPLLAAVAIVLSAVLDGVDGAVAVVGRSESSWGYVLDTVADRCSELMFLACAFVLGAPPALTVAIGTLTLLQESARARAVSAGLKDVGVLTVWERPSRVVVALVVTAGSGIAPDSTAFVTLMSSIVGVALAVSGFVQLMVVLHRRLA